MRREKVLLEVESELAPVMLRDAAAVAMLKRELHGLSGQAVTTSRSLQTVERDNDRLARSSTKANSSINQLTGRLRLLADVAAILGPALVPIGGVGLAGVAGLANMLGVAALAGGTAVIAFQGVGDALKAVNKAALEPTTANLEAAREAMEQLSPAAIEMVVQLRELRPVLLAIRDAGAEGLFPGVIDAIDELESRGPAVERIVHNLGQVLGELAGDAGTSLASADWDEFFDFLATDAADSLASLGRATGDLTHGLAELWMAFDPLNDDFNGWLEGVASGFDSWSTGLDQTQGFREFLEYVRTTGPQVADTFGALAGAVVQIAQASAPLGGPVLHALESVARLVATIADSDLGTPIMAAVTAMALLNRAKATFNGLTERGWGATARGSITGMVSALGAVTSAQDRARLSATQLATAQGQRNAAIGAGVATMGQAAAGIGLMATAMTDLDDKAGVATTAMGGFTGVLLGGKKGGAIGLAAGAIIDISKAFSVSSDEMENFIRLLDASSGAAGGGLEGQIAGTVAEIERLQTIMDNDHGLSLGFTKLWSSVDAAQAADRVEVLTDHLDDLRTQLRLQEIEAGNAGAKYGWLGNMIGGILPNLNDVNRVTRDAADGQITTRGAMRAMGLQAGPTAERLKELQDALEEERESAAGVAGEFVNLGKGLDDAKVSLGQWLRNLEKQADALRNFRINAQQAAKKGLNDVLIVSLQQAGTEGALRMKQLANATDAEINRANRAWRRGQKEIDKYVDATVDVPPALATDITTPGLPQAQSGVTRLASYLQALDRVHAQPNVNIGGVPQSIADLNALEARLNSIQDETVFVNVRRIGGPQPGPAADGATVPKTGRHYADRHLYLLADGEEVVSNRYGQADRHRSLLKAINANRMADGGTAMTRTPHAPVHVTTSTGPLTATVALMRQELDEIKDAVRDGAREGVAAASAADTKAGFIRRSS